MNTDEVASSLLGNVVLLAATFGGLAAIRVGAPKRNTVRMLLYSIFQISVCIAAISCMKWNVSFRAPARAVVVVASRSARCATAKDSWSPRDTSTSPTRGTDGFAGDVKAAGLWSALPVVCFPLIGDCNCFA